MTVKQTLDAADEVFARLWDELEEGGHFFYIPIKRAKAFEVKEPFGPRVSAKFPKLGEDIEDAHKCYACGRYTACVFHLMRVVEVAVQRLGKKLGVKNAKNLVWQVILDQVNLAIKSLPAKSPKTKKFAAVTGHLYNVKVAWRNEVMHPKETYTEEEAETLLSLVKVFMVEVASVI
jgi:HEPN domain-containing protein